MYENIDIKITKVEGISLSSPYGDGKSLGQPLGVKSIGLVRITDEAGNYGIGETYSGVYSPDIIKIVIKFFEQYIIGKKIGDDSFIKNIEQIPFIGGKGIFQSILSAIEIALFDLRGKILQVPSYKLLSKKFRESIPVYASSGTAVFSPDEIESDVNNILDLGFNAYKMRIGYQDWNNDLKRIRAAKRILDKKKLMVDAIMGTLRPPWETKTAIEKVHDLIDFNLYWLEEPLFPDNIEGLKELKNLNLVPIAAGEAYSSRLEFDLVLKTNALNFLQFDATHSGGMKFCYNLANQASRYNMKSALHVWGSAAAISANSHVGISNPLIDYLEIPMVKLDLTDEMWIEKPTIERGLLIPNDLPGLGIKLTDKLISKYYFKKNSGYRIA